MPVKLQLWSVAVNHQRNGDERPNNSPSTKCYQSQVDLEDDINSDEETPWIAANCWFNSFNNVVINWISYE